MVCQGRAAGHGRFGADRFDDPVAAHLLRPGERVVVEAVRARRPPRGLRARLDYELVVAVTAVLVTRTVVIDESVCAAANPQVVVLGAGLDARAWRMPELADSHVFEVDHPSSQHDKRERIDGCTPTVRAVTFVPVDFARDTLGPALAAAGHDASVPTTWIWEGVLPYLTATEVDSTLAEVRDRSAPGSRLIASYTPPQALARLGRALVGIGSRLTGGRSPWAHEPNRSHWSSQRLHGVLARSGLTVVDDHDLRSVATQLGVDGGYANQLGRVVVAEVPR